MIPRVVYQTWHQYILPPCLYNIQQYNRRLNPDLQFKLYNDQDIDLFWTQCKSELPSEFNSQIYYRINPKYGSCRADIFRYAIIYVFGGIYMDIKIKCKVPFRDWISFEDDMGIFSYWQNKSTQKEFLQNEFGEIQNWFLVFQKKDPILYDLLLSIHHKISNLSILNYFGKAPVLYFTGPLIYTKVIESYLDFHSNNYRFISSWFVLEYGNFFHEKIYPQHYSKLMEPLFVKKNISIPYETISLNDTRSLLPPGIYLFFMNKYNTIQYQCKYSLEYLCFGIDILLGYSYPFLFFGSNEFTSIDVMNDLLSLYCKESQDKLIFHCLSNKIMKRTCIQTNKNQYSILYHHQIFLTVDISM